MNKRLPVFDWIRSVAIITILFHHLPNYTFNFYDLRNFGIPLNLSILNELSGYFGLSLFIFMSGYLLNAKKVHFSSWGEVRSFAKQKSIRIVPLYYLALVLFSFTEGIHNPVKILIHLLGLQLVFETSTHFIPIRTLWFVGLISIYYSVFAVIKCSRLSKKLRSGILISSWILPLALNGFLDMTDYRISLYWVIFWFGILCSEKQLPELKLWKYLSQASAVLFVAMLVCIHANFESLIGSGSTFVLKYILLNAFMFSSVVTTYSVCHWLTQHLQFRAELKFIAYISYCMYLFHRPVWYVMNHLLVNQLAVDSQYFQLAALTIVGLPLIMALSYGLQVTYDRDLKRYLLATFKMT